MSKRSSQRNGDDTNAKRVRSNNGTPRRPASREAVSSEDDDGGTTAVQAGAVAGGGAAAAAAAAPVAATAEIVKFLLVDMQSKNATTVNKAAEKLKSLLEDNQTNCNELFELQGLGALISTMKKWKAQEAIQTNCLACFEYFVFEVPDDCLQGAITALMKMQAVEHVVAVLRKFPTNKILQLSGIASLGNLFYTGNKKVTKDVAIKFANEMDGFLVVIAAMKKFRDCWEIHDFGCWLFAKYIDFGENVRVKMLESGVLCAVSESKTAHPHCKDINENTVIVTKYICSAD